jgi:hypothetical protein
MHTGVPAFYLMLTQKEDRKFPGGRPYSTGVELTMETVEKGDPVWA